MNPNDHRPNLQKLAEKRRILLLQGPVGSFFLRLSEWLQQHGATVFKINFNGGDALYYPPQTANCHTFHGHFENFHTHLTRFADEYQIDAVVCFGDTRPYHETAKRVCGERVGYWENSFGRAA